MRILTNLILIALLIASIETAHGSRRVQDPAAQEQGAEQGDQKASQQPQTSSSAAVQSVTGCLVRDGGGYSLRTDTDTLPIESEKDLSQYVDKKITVTGILEHHNASSSSSARGPVTITDLRLRLVVSVIGDCSHVSK